MERTRAIRWSFSRVKCACGFCSMTTTRSLARPGAPVSASFGANAEGVAVDASGTRTRVTGGVVRPGMRLCVFGRGMPNQKTGTRGDVLFEIESVEFPKTVTEAQRAAFKNAFRA